MPLQRIPAILVLLGFSFSLFAPFVSSDSGQESKLPPCCRRDGSHHCSMMKAAAHESESAPSVKAASTKCPLYPTGQAMPVPAKAIAARPMVIDAAPAWSRPNAIEQTEARYRLSFSRASQKRGPPFRLS